MKVVTSSDESGTKVETLSDKSKMRVRASSDASLDKKQVGALVKESQWVPGVLTALRRDHRFRCG